jgi:hypothetical protein
MGFEGDWDKFPVDCQLLVDSINKNTAKAVYAAATAYAGDVIKCTSTPVDTGQYRSSIRADPPADVNSPVSYVGTPMPQARRLEFGFYDMDSLGRVFNQHPRPHWRPTFDSGKATYLDIMAKTLQEKA